MNRLSRVGPAMLAVVLAVSGWAAPAPGRAEPSEERPRAGGAGGAGPAGGVRPADRAYLGYRIPRTQRAGSGFIGSRRVGRQVVYRTDPRRTVPLGGFASARWTDDFRASSGRPVGARRTACAAQLLSQYGRTGPLDRLRRLQAAGVDVAVQHLLHGGRFRTGGPAQRRRTNQVAKGPLVRAFARNLVEDFCRFSGPYTVTLAADRTVVDVGGEVTYTASVTSRTGAPMRRVRVLLTVGAGPAVAIRTGDDGTASLTVDVADAGPLSTNVVTHRLPEVRVRVLAPRRAGASRAVVAGLHQGFATPRTQTIAVRARPTVRLDPDRPVARTAPFRLRFTTRGGYPGARTALLQVVGPLPPEGSGPGADCGDASVIRRTTVAVDADRTYASAPLRLHRTGVYLWRVTVPGSTYNRPLTVCGAKFRVTR